MKKQNKIQKLEKRIIDLEKQCKSKDRKWYLFPVFLLTLLLTITWVYLSIKYFGMFEIFILEPEQVNFMNLRVIPNILFNYLLISLTFISLTIWIKGGFDKLKNYNKEGLMYGSIDRLIIGLIVGLIFGLIAGLIVGLIGGLIGGLIAGLIFGLIFGLIAGLIFGLIFGLVEEFK